MAAVGNMFSSSAIIVQWYIHAGSTWLDSSASSMWWHWQTCCRTDCL